MNDETITKLGKNKQYRLDKIGHDNSPVINLEAINFGAIITPLQNKALIPFHRKKPIIRRVSSNTSIPTPDRRSSTVSERPDRRSSTVSERSNRTTTVRGLPNRRATVSERLVSKKRRTSPIEIVVSLFFHHFP